MLVGDVKVHLQAAAVMRGAPVPLVSSPYRLDNVCVRLYQDADVVIVDDLIDSGNSLAARVELLKEQGAKRYTFARATVMFVCFGCQTC